MLLIEPIYSIGNKKMEIKKMNEEKSYNELVEEQSGYDDYLFDVMKDLKFEEEYNSDTEIKFRVIEE